MRTAVMGPVERSAKRAVYPMPRSSLRIHAGVASFSWMTDWLRSFVIACVNSV